MEPSDNQFREKRADNAAELLSREEDPSGVQRPRLNLSVGRITSPEGPDRTSLYRGLMDQAAPLYLADFGGNLVYTNKAFAGIARVLFGLSHDVAAGDETPPALMKIIEKIYLDMRPVQAKDAIEIEGETRTYMSRHFPIRDEDGELLGFGGIYTDISGQTRAFLRAGQMEGWLQDVIRSASDWVWETDANFNLSFVSPRISEALGLPSQLLIGKHLFSLGRFEDDRDTGDSAKKIMEHHAPFRHRLFLMEDDRGKIRHIHLSGVPVFNEVGGRFSGYRGTGTDFTRQYEAEQSAFQAKVELEKTLDDLKQRNLQLDLALEKAQTADKAKMDFLAMMSHELRTPLNAIIGFSEAASQKIFGPLNDTYFSHFNDILKAGRHLLAIINDILDTAKIENQELSVEVTPVPARELIAEARSLVALRAAEKNLDTEAVDIEDRWTLLVDRVRARQILVNLLGNAVKFTPEGSSIGVEAREASDGKLAVTVWDTGVGIPAHEQERVFEHFYQVESDILSRRDEGTGLGLSVSLYLARRMGGDLTLESGSDRGARFTVMFALAKPVAPVPVGN